MELTITDKVTIACLRSVSIPYKIRSEFILIDGQRRIKVFYDFIFNKVEKELKFVDEEIKEEIENKLKNK